MGEETEELISSFEDTRARLLAGLERAHELICEARQVIGAQENAGAEPTPDRAKEPLPPSP